MAFGCGQYGGGQVHRGGVPNTPVDPSDGRSPAARIARKFSIGVCLLMQSSTTAVLPERLVHRPDVGQRHVGADDILHGCHLGRVAVAPSQRWVTVEGVPVLVHPDPEGKGIGGCPNSAAGKVCTSTIDGRVMPAAVEPLIQALETIG